MLVSPCRAWLGVAAEAPKPLQVMSSQAQGILEGETSAPAYRGADEQAGQDGRIPFLNGRDGRISEGAPRLEAVSVASAAEVVSDLPGTEPARMEPTGHGARDEEQRTLYPYRAQVNEHSVPQQQQQQQVLQQSSPIRDFLGVPADAPQQQQQQGVPHRQAQQPGGMMGQHDATVTLQQVTTRVVTTSPPEDLPAPPDQPHGAQAMWIARLGEFFQRRVTQAAAAVAPVLERSPRPNFRAIPPAPSSWGASREAPLFTPEAEQVMQQWPKRAPLLHGQGAPGLPPPPLPKP